MQTKDILLVLTDRWADWETTYAVSMIKMESDSQYTVKTIAVDKEPKATVGGLRTAIDYTVAEYNNLDNLAMIILPGGFDWKNKPYDDIATLVRKAVDAKIPIAAACAATFRFLGRHGFLDKVKHTGYDLETFQSEQGYNGQDFYVAAQVVVDNGFITAHETAALEFAQAIFRTLKMMSEEDIDEWYDYYKNGAM